MADTSSKIHCIACGEQYFSQEPTCPACGKPNPTTKTPTKTTQTATMQTGNTMYCKQCGNQIPNEAVVCVHCGVPTNKVKAEPEGVSQGVLVTGYVLAFLLPIIGFIVGIYAMVKGAIGHGIAMLVLSILSISLWTALLSVWSLMAAAGG